MKSKRRANRVHEDSVYYGAASAGVVVMEGRRLDEAEQYMRSLRAKAVKVSKALTDAGVPHAVIGGMAVLAHALRAGQGFERMTRDLDILIKRTDLERVAQALQPLDFRYRQIMGIPAFVPPQKPDQKKSRFQEGVHIVWAGERVRPADPVPAPTLDSRPVVLAPDGYVCLDVENLLRMKLTSFRLKDQVHVQDLLQIGLITKKIEAALPADLRKRLEHVKEETKREGLG